MDDLPPAPVELFGTGGLLVRSSQRTKPVPHQIENDMPAELSAGEAAVLGDMPELSCMYPLEVQGFMTASSRPKRAIR